MTHLCFVAIKHQGGTPSRFTDALFGGLAPAWMVHVRVHIGKETIFMWRILVPSGAGLQRQKLDFHERLDALETVLPGNDQADGRAILWRQCAAIQSAGQQCQRVHRFIHSQALYIGPYKYVAALPRHALGVEQGLEGDILRLVAWLDHLKQFKQRKPYPRNDHRPSLDATHTVYPFFRRTDFQ